MVHSKADKEDMLDALASEYLGSEAEPEDGAPKLRLKWKPKLNSTQQLVYDCTAPVILGYGERGTGKTLVFLHKLVRHCVNNQNALAFVCVKEVGQAADGGAWDKLMREVLPTWQLGNFDRATGTRIDNGMGIEFTKVGYDPSTKKPYVFVSNKFGGWSKIMLLSLFVDAHVLDKVKGREPSFIFFDEAQTTDSADYHMNLDQQVGRRQGITGQQQLCYGANPKGPTHWLYKLFFTVTVTDKEGEESTLDGSVDEKTGSLIHPVTGKPVKGQAVFHVPIAENVHNLPPGYWERVQNACRNDKVEEARMVHGLWVDKPEGDVLFDEWEPGAHVRGEAGKNQGVLPMKGHSVIMSWDPGSAHHAVTFQQFFPTAKGIYWVWFDEFDSVGKYVNFPTFVPLIVERMRYWEERSECEFKFMHVSDDSAFNQFRARDGSYDVEDIERLSKEYVEKKGYPERFIIKLRPCPKGPHSVERRVAIMKELLSDKRLLISAICVKSQEMFLNLEREKGTEMSPRRTKHIHRFDSGSYSALYYRHGAGKAQVNQVPVKTEFYVVGKG